MKNNIREDKEGRGPHRPFWQPWGWGGCLCRALLFLLLLSLLLLLLSLVRRCDTDRNPAPNVLYPVDSIGHWYGDINIPNPGPNLPSPEKNYLLPPRDKDVEELPEQGRRYVGNLLNVMLDSTANDDSFRRWAASYKQAYPQPDYKVVYYDPLTKLMQIRVPDGKALEVMAELPQKISRPKFMVFPEGLMGTWSKPDDPVFRDSGKSWYFGNIQAYEAWDITMGSEDVTVAVVDTYFDLRHEDLNSPRIYHPYSIALRNGNVAPPAGAGISRAVKSHGTLVAALAVGNANNRKGSCGIAPNCRLMPVSMGNRLSSMTMLQGLLYAIYQGADVVNISAGVDFNPQIAGLPVREQIQLASRVALEEEKVWDYAFSLADARNVTVVWAAGNQNVFTALDPSKRGKNTIRVASTDKSNGKASFSDFGNFPQWNVSEITIAAPGTSIFGAISGNSYGYMEGTSFSAPIVAGTVALMKSKNKDLKNSDIIRILQQSGAPVRGNSTIGRLIQIRNALERV